MPRLLNLINKLVIASVVIAILFNLTAAQKKTTVLGDTWTGVVVATDDPIREITIQYEEKGKPETFKAVLAEGYQVKMKDGSSHDLTVSEIPIGTRVRAFFKTTEQTRGGIKVKINRISRIDFLGRDEFSRLRESLNLEPSFVVTLEPSENLPAATPLKVYLAIAIPNLKDNFIDWVIKWNKENALKYGSLAIVSDLSQADIALVAYRGSEIMVVPLPLEVYDAGGNVHKAVLSHATACLVIKEDRGLKVLWRQVMVIATSEKSDSSKASIEKEIEKRMKARSKK